MAPSGCAWEKIRVQHLAVNQGGSSQQLEISESEELLQGGGVFSQEKRRLSGTVSCLQIFGGLSCGRGQLVLWVDGCQLQSLGRERKLRGLNRAGGRCVKSGGPRWAEHIHRAV